MKRSNLIRKHSVKFITCSVRSYMKAAIRFAYFIYKSKKVVNLSSYMTACVDDCSSHVT